MERVRQAGAVAFRTAHPEPLWLLVTARRQASAWIFPKGHLEPGEDVAAAALRELREEAGVDGRIVAPLGTLAFRSGDEDVEVSYFLIEATTDGKAGEGRRTQWLPFAEAQRLLRYDDARQLLEQASRRLPDAEFEPRP